MPILCNYYLTYRCNASCAFCRFGDHDTWRGAGLARKEDVLRNLSGLRRLGVRFVDFTGGEPLLHPDTPDFLAAAKRLGMRTSITTNGILYPRHAERIRDLVDLLHFSLDGGDAASHDTLRGAACFDAVMESIRIARDLGEFPDILFTVTGDNFADLPAVHRIARRNGLVLLLNPLFADRGEGRLSLEALAYIEEFAQRPGVYCNPSLLALRRVGGNDPAHPLCRAVTRVIVISPDNEVLLPCYHFQAERIPIGRDLIGAHRNPEVERHRRLEGRHSFCSGCAVNCYFEPSFAFPTNRYGLAAVPSKFRYGYHKYVRQPLSGLR